MSQTQRRNISPQDIQQASVNRQNTLSGTSLTVKDSGNAESSFFITSIIGTTVTLADKDGSAIMVVPSSISFYTPIRVDGGFQLSASATAYVTYFWL